MCATKVADICTRAVVSISEDAPLIDIATIMTEKRVHPLPVIRGGKVVGIVGKRDLLKAMARQTE